DKIDNHLVQTACRQGAVARVPSRIMYVTANNRVTEQRPAQCADHKRQGEEHPPRQQALHTGRKRCLRRVVNVVLEFDNTGNTQKTAAQPGEHRQNALYTAPGGRDVIKDVADLVAGIGRIGTADHKENGKESYFTEMTVPHWTHPHYYSYGRS